MFEQVGRGCYQCIITSKGEIVPRPLGHGIHGERPTEVAHMDLLYMGQGLSNNKYLLIIKENLSSFIWMWPTENTTAASAAEALCVSIGVFRATQWLVSDQSSQLKYRLISELMKELQTKHQFTTAYSPLANGSV